MTYTNGGLSAHAHAFLVSGSFLTRLFPARTADTATMAAAVAWFPAVGLVLGAVCVLPFALGLAHGHASIQGWLYAGLYFWLTRGLHWDGWSDLLDAWGSCATGDRFWDIMKDSRVGAFGVMGLVLGLTGQMQLVSTLVDAGHWLALAWAPMAGRAAIIVLAGNVPAGPRSTLGRLTTAGATPAVQAAAAATTIVAGLLLAGPRAVLVALPMVGIVLLGLARLGRREGGINGDFMGAGIVSTELLVMLACLL